MGMDAGNPLRLQQDMAFLRELRQSQAAIRQKGMMVILGIVLSAVVAALWVGLKAAVNS